jgi:outer membrane protein assembly factor BamB
VRSRWTTRCCSAVALIGAAALARGAPAKRPPLSLFPLAPLWALALNADIAVPPAFDGSVGYFALTGDRIVAYDLREGTQKWIVDAKPLFEPAAGDGLLFSVEPETLTARSASDGSIVWSCALTDELAAPPAWDNGWLIVATRAHEVLAYRANDGRLIWRQKIAGDAHARPALVADRVYVPTDTGHVLALRVDTGDTVWDQSVNAAANDVLALDDRVYVGSNDNHLYCLLAKDGSVDWKWPTGGDVVGLASHDEHNVYFVSLDNVLRALGMKSGGQRWKAPLPMRPARGPTQAGDVLIVTGLTSKVAAFAAKDGKPAGDVPASGDLAAPPHLIATGAHALPVLIMVTRDIAKGATVTAFTRSVEPPVAPIAPLPNITTVPLPKS